MRSALQYFLGKPQVPEELAKARAIDLSIQFSIFWMPFFILLSWWIDKPLHMLFGTCLDSQKGHSLNHRPLDPYEVAALIGSAFLVNYITSDAKTNWVRPVIPRRVSHQLIDVSPLG